MMKKERIAYLDALRIFAMFMVIMLHTAADQWWLVFSVNRNDWEVLNFYNSVVRFAVPIFAMISGALFLDPKTQISIRKLYSKNVMHLVISFFLWSLFYTIWEVYRDRISDVGAFFSTLIDGHFHMWFIYMIIGFYIIVPIIRDVIMNKKILQYGLLLSLCFTFIVPTCCDVIFQQGIVHDVLTYVIDKLGIYITLGYLPYFLLGHYIHQYPISPRNEKIIYIFGIIGAVTTTALSNSAAIEAGEPTEIFYLYNRINVLVMAVGIFVFFKYHIKMMRENTKKIIQNIANHSLCIYYVHAFVLSCLVGSGISAISFTPILAVPIITLVTFIISYCIALLLSKIPIVGKLVG